MEPLTHPRLRTSGFTLIEMVVVLVLVGTLAAVAIPRLADRSAFDQRGFLDQTRAAIQLARKSAVAQRRNMCVAVTSGTVSITRALVPGPAAACAATLSDPATGRVLSLTAPSGVSLSPAMTLVFDALGRLASPAGDTAISVSGMTTAIVIAPETGYVH